MTAHDFVFSGERPVRYLRHCIFWLCWWMFFAVITYTIWETGAVSGKAGGSLQVNPSTGIILFILSKSFIFLLVQAAACYFLIYNVMLRFLHNRNFAWLAGGVFATTGFLLIGGYFIQVGVLPFVDAAFHVVSPSDGQLWSSIRACLLNAPKVIGIAGIIKLFTLRWREQQQKEQLETELLNTQLNILKMQVHPGFLFGTLNSIYSSAIKQCPATPGLLLQFSDILSYLLYDCDDKLVPVQKEIDIIKHYLTLEQTKHGTTLEMSVRFAGDLSGHRIVPLLLWYFVEDGIRQATGPSIEQPWMNLDIRMSGSILFIKLMHAANHTSKADDTAFFAAETQLQLAYADRHEMKLVREEGILMRILKIDLDETSGAFGRTSQENELSTDSTLQYAIS